MPVYEKVGGEFAVNTTYARTQAQSEVTTLADGRFLVIWTDADFTVFSNRYLRAQIFEADGTAVGSELTLTGPVDRMNEPSVAALEGGGFVTVWRDIWTMNVQRYDGEGVPVGSPIVVSTVDVTGPVEITATAGGGFAVAWIRGGSEDQSTILLRTYDASGVAASGEVTVNGSTLEDYATYVGLSVAALADGNIVVTWFDVNGSASDDNQFMARVFTAAGVPLGAEFALNPAGDHVTYGEAPVVALANGNFAISWTQLAVPEGVLATHTQIFTASGVQVGEPIVTLSNAFNSPALAGLSDGSLAVVYTMGGLFVQVYNADGTARGTPIQVETQTNGAQVDPSISALADNGFVVTWTDYNGAGADDDQVKAQVFGPAVAITSNGGGDTASVTIGENGLLATQITAATGADAPLGFAIAGGADAALFAIDAGTGALTFIAAPDHEAPADANGDNVYEVIVRASDGTREDTQSLSISVGNVNDIAPVISGYAGSAAVIDVAENSVLVEDFAATDADGNPVTFTLGGADADRFSVDPATGLVQFLAAPDYEAPGSSQGTNTYEIILAASDGVFSDVLNLTVNVTNVDLNIFSNGGGDTAAFSLAENQTVATTVVARDATGPIVYSISGGSDASRFAIDAATGALSFVTAPNYEAPNDVGANRVYDVVVTATDGSFTDTQALAITITNINEAPVITSNGGGDTAAISINENTTFITYVSSTDPENTARTYSIVGGADAARFSINPSTGGMSLVSVANFESPTDAGGNNVYDVIVQASDGSLVDTQAIAVTVLNSDEAPVITSNGGGSSAAVSVNENTTFVTTVTSTDPENAPRTYSISGGTDASRFTIDAATGVLSFVSAPNRESPNDVGANNVYDVTVRASDGFYVDTQAIAVTVANVNEAPVITSNGGGSSAAVTVSENTFAVTTVTSTDPENTARIYSIVGGADAARFTIVENTGALSFISTPNFEAPADAGANNVYDVVVQASDGTLADTQAIAVTISNANEAPVITSNGGGASASISVNENTTAVTTVVASDVDGTAATYSLFGGADASRFTINASTGALSFVSAPNFELPSDSGANNVYNVTVRASDGSLTDTQTLTITVGNVDEAPVITSNGGSASAAISVNENATAVTTVVASNPEGGLVTYALAGGADADRFVIDASTGALSFISAPNFEVPTDAGGDNVYDVVVEVSDGSLTDTQTIAVTVANVNEAAPVISSNGGGAAASITVDENTTAVTTVVASDLDGTGVTYMISGGADAARFAINASTGALSFVAAPDYEAPADSGANNVYNVTVAASDGTLTDTQALSVSVADVTEAAPLEFGTTSYDTYENSFTVILFDVTGGDGSIAYSIVGGADAALFSINHGAAALNLGVQNFEAPADADGDGLYEVQVRAVSGAETVDATIVVAVGNTNDGEGPFFLTEPEWTIDEGEDSVGFVQAPASYEGSVTYSVIGGPDAGSLVIDEVTGELSFLETPDFEAPADADGNNVYEVLIAADSYDPAYAGTTATQWVTVTVADVDPEENPVGFAQTAFEVPEILTFSAALEVTGAELLSLSVVGGEDGWLFDVDTFTGELMMIYGAFDFESPYDYDGDNVYEVEVEAWTGYEYITSTISVTVRDAVNEELFFVTDGTWAAIGGEAFVGTVAAFDAQYDALTYTIAGGADAALFTLDAYSGELSFIAAPDFEFPVDAGGDNVYDIELAVSDGQTTEYQTVTVTVGEPEPEAPSPFVQAEFAADENSILSMGLELVDPAPGYTAFWITGGADSDHFFIDSGTGELLFSGDFEAWADDNYDNVFEVEVTAVGGGGEVTGTVRVTLQDVDEAPDLVPWPISINENSLNGGWVYAWDPENQPLTYAIAGGADGGLFTIDSNTGFLRFTSAADFEAPADADGNNVYDVIVEVSDGSLSTTAALTVNVQNVGEGPVITSNGGGAAASLTVNENATAVTTVAASDPENGVTYSLVAGGDAARFAINASTGALTFVAAPNYEAPSDGGADNVYNVTVRASDGSLTDTQALAITVANLNETPVITSNGGGASAAISVSENATAVSTVTSTDPEGSTRTYSLAGGADAALFAIDSVTGALSFVTAPDFEAPADANGDNVYEVIVSASDGSLADTQAISVTVGNVNEGVAITSPASASVLENGTAVTTVTAADVDGDAVVFAIAGGADAASFAIDAATGALSFITPPDYDAPADAGGDNVYDVVVSASDGSLSDTQALAVTVGNVNEGPVITSNGGGASAALSVLENGTAVTTVVADDAAGAVTYSVVGGEDSEFFTIDESTGVLSFNGAPDFDNPSDFGEDNVYEVVVRASDGIVADTQALSITVGDVEEAPVILSTTDSLNENHTFVGSIWAGDSDNDPLTYSVVGGADGGLFTVNWEGKIYFRAAPDFEAPGDADGDNVYELTVGVSDGTTTTTGTIMVTVNNLNEAPDIVSNGGSINANVAVTENTTAVTTVVAADPEGGVTYSLAGDDAALFTLDAATGVLSFAAAPDFEAPADRNGDNRYDLMVTASDGTFSAFQYVYVHVGDVNEGVTIASPASAAALENGTAVTTVTASDLDGDAVTYALAGGADAALFAIDSVTGALSFLAAPNFEAPADADGDNVYEVVVSASDGSLSDTQALSVIVGNANEGVSIASPASASVQENGFAVATVTASDLDGDAVGFSLVGGADASLFALDAETGALSFVTAPDFEAPADADGDNVYEVIVSASDGTLADTQAISVTVGNVNEAPVIGSNGGGASASLAVAENAAAVTTVAASDAEGPVTYALAGGADAALFAIDAATGALSFVYLPDFEAPADADGDNVYDVVVSASDGTLADTQALSVTVGNVNEAPTIVSDGGGTSAALELDEGQTAVTTVVAADPDGPGALTYSITGGPDAALFAIDSATGALTLVAAPDYEAPADFAEDNFYTVTVTASDGELSTFQSISVMVRNVNEGVTITSAPSAAVLENAAAVTTVTATDLDGDTVAFEIAGGADAALFAIDAASGALTFVSAPNFEAPADADGDNVYDVLVRASDGTLSDTQALAVTVGNVNEAPVITSGGGGVPAAYSLGENATAVATIAASDAESGVTYTLVGGADAARFAIDAASGALTFVSAPNFEAPTDADGDNVYEVLVSASDGTLSDTQALAVTVGNVNEAPVITSGGGGAAAAYALDENATAVATIAAADAEGGVTYALAGGADAARFAIDAVTGALTFVAAPDFDAPADAGANNVYDVIVSASDGSLTDMQALAITVGNVSDGLTLTGTSQANTLTGSYEEDSISGLAGNDTLRGLAAADVLNGGDGQDRLFGGTGADVLTGGAKADVFEFETLADSTTAASDRILDFTRSQGDKIELFDIDANTAVAGNQAFSFIGTAAFSNQAGQLRYFQQDGDTFIAGDVDGNGAADFQIVVDPLVSFIASDFIL